MTPFDAALLSRTCVLELATGERIELPTARWRAEPGEGDELMLTRCAGPTLDIGCGPGRLTAELTARGVPSLGIDVSPTAVRLTRERGGTALRRDVFRRLPGEGRWRHALLADGNIGIGGDPVALLRRVRDLLAPGGRVLVELEPGRVASRDRVRIGDGAWFPWARLGVGALGGIADAAALRIGWTAAHGSRHFTELVR
ncbi:MULTISPECIES: class I SAM-dependent methyltransferase [Amycolatopsis]|uniref:Class I SAM-dependent methyltransferase n=1 Tax=Amycolatopsis dongchuanensis TaxID=1070866 RepID=A0ABP9QFX6_9PSEU